MFTQFCKCGGVIQTTSYSNICIQCGIETRVLCCDRVLPGYERSHSRMRSVTTYSRRYRFNTLLKKTVLFHSGPSIDDPIWKHLEAGNKQTPFTNTRDIMKCLSSYPAKNKKYCCCPIFTTTFQLCKHPNVGYAQIDRGMFLFDQVEAAWKRHPEMVRFLSYYYLLEKVLIAINCSELLKITKRLMCPKRRDRYDHVLKRLGIKSLSSSAEEYGF